MYSLTRLRILREVDLRGSLAAAAEALDYDPSSVSHQLKALEKEAGVRLLEPVGRGVRLTDEARILVSHTTTVLAELERARARIARARKEVGGTLRVATFQTALQTFVASTLPALRATFPDLELEITHISVDEGLPALLAHDFDLVLQESYPHEPPARRPEVHTTVLGSDPLVLVAPPDSPMPSSPTPDPAVSGPATAVLSDHAEAAWAMEADWSPAGHWARAECRRAGFEPRVHVVSCDVVAQIRLVAAGLAHALVPQLALDAAHGLPGVEAVRRTALPGSPARTITSVVRAGAADTPSVRALEAAWGEALRGPGAARSVTAAKG